MNNFTKLSLLLACFLTFGTTANAQWDVLYNLFNQFDEGTNQFYGNNLDSLEENWNPNDSQSEDLFAELFDNLQDSVPPGELDGDYLDGLDAVLDTLVDHLPGYGLSGTDTDTLLGELDWVNGIFNDNVDSLGGLFGQYQDSLAQVPNYWDLSVVSGDSLQDEQYDYLEENTNAGLGNPNGLGNFSHIFGQLFDANIFPDIEIAFGTQSADLKYYSDEYSANAKVVRLGSVPRFDRNSIDCHNGTRPSLPIEARWHVEVSWTDQERNTSFGSDAIPRSSNSDGKNFNPLMMSGDFAIMTTPTIGTLGNTTFKMLTSLGTELGTYAPAHRDYNYEYTLNNKGYMTGLGAQVGAGFSFTTGAITAYSMATFAQGQALRCPKPYPYTSRRYEVGIRYGNIINVRYSTGRVSWQALDNRLANVRNQFTVGIILAQLHH